MPPRIVVGAVAPHGVKETGHFPGQGGDGDLPCPSVGVRPVSPAHDHGISWPTSQGCPGSLNQCPPDAWWSRLGDACGLLAFGARPVARNQAQIGFHSVSALEAPDLVDRSHESHGSDRADPPARSSVADRLVPPGRCARALRPLRRSAD
jgi:hypothetical protein